MEINLVLLVYLIFNIEMSLLIVENFVFLTGLTLY